MQLKQFSQEFYTNFTSILAHTIHTIQLWKIDKFYYQDMHSISYLKRHYRVAVLVTIILTCLLNDCRNAKSHDANDDRLLEIDTVSSLLLPSVSLLITVKLLYIVSLRLGVLLYSDSPRSFDLDLKMQWNKIYIAQTNVFAYQ